MISDLDIYLFDLRGYLLVEDALTADEVTSLNDCLDEIPSLKPGEWHGYIQGHTYGDGTSGINYQQIYEAGEPFEQLIDHPSWFEYMKLFIGAKGSFDELHGPMFIDECFANFRGPGEAIGLHSGGIPPIQRNQYRYHGGRFMCGQVNVLIALTEIGVGDGGTMLIPGSHKSNFKHPKMLPLMGEDRSVDDIEGAVNVYMKEGDALIFVDGLSHGSARRINLGTRRIIVYRYGPSWGNFRHGYKPSRRLLDRLTLQRRRIVQPQVLLQREPQIKK